MADVTHEGYPVTMRTSVGTFLGGAAAIVAAHAIAQSVTPQTMASYVAYSASLVLTLTWWLTRGQRGKACARCATQWTGVSRFARGATPEGVEEGRTCEDCDRVFCPRCSMFLGSRCPHCEAGRLRLLWLRK
jgi:hypothetical protein